MKRRAAIVGGAIVAVLLLAPGTALACGGLVGENGTITLGKTTTLAAYSDGIERYVTAFEFSGSGESVGSIVPLPDAPTKVERAGDWTLQRLVQEITPPPPRDFAEFSGAESAAAGDSAEVLLETEVDALDITVLKGGGDEVGEWALDNGFFLPPDAPEVLDFYAERSPIFMAAKFDARRAAELGQANGDSTPIMATIPTDDPWVPLRILSLGLDGGEQVKADVFLLTDHQPNLLAGGPGLEVKRSERASRDLMSDLRSDVGMKWMPNSLWLSYLELNADARDLDYDLAVADGRDREPTLTDAGIGPASAVPIRPPRSWWPLGVGALAGLAAVFVVALAQRGTSGRTPVTS